MSLIRFCGVVQLFAVCLLACVPAVVCRGAESSGGILSSRVLNLTDKEILRTADSCYNAKNNDKALSLYLLLIESGENSDKSSLMGGYWGAGNVLMRRCGYAGALNYYVEGLKICEQQPPGAWRREWAAELYKSIGNVYSSIDDYEQGIRYYKLALDECGDDTDILLRSRILYNLAGFSTYVGNSHDAHRYLSEARSLEMPRDNDFIFLDMFIEGMALGCDGRYEEAAAMIKKSARQALDSGIAARYVCSAWQHLYQVYDNMHLTDSAYRYMKECERHAEANGILTMFPNLLNALSAHYQKTGASDMAREYRYRYLHMRDSLNNVRDFDAVKNVQMQYEAEKTARKIRQLHVERDRQRNILLGMGIGMIVLSAVLWYIIRQRNKLRRSYASLYRINRTFAACEEEMRFRHKADADRISDLEKRIDILSEKGNDGSECVCSGEVVADPGEVTEIATDVSVKYKTSNLKESTRGKLAEEIEHIMENEMAYCNPDFSLDSLAEKIGTNTKYISQTINEAFGRNFSTYVNDYRVRLAGNRLTDPGYAGYTVFAVGESVGFKSQSSFASVFRKYTGLTPSMFRKMSQITKKGNL